MGIFGDWARQYHECGLSIIPVEKKTKKPLVSYDLYREKHAPEDVLSEWEKKFKNENIGLVTGPASRIVVIDIDIKNNPELLSKALSLLPRSPIEKFGAKGLSILVKFENQVGQKIRYHGQEIGELIVNTQTVIPPSIHPDTNKPYIWTSYKALGDDHIDDIFDDLPSFTNEDLEIFEKKLENSNAEVDSDFYKQIIGRNNKLKAICGALFNQGLLPEEIAPRLLAEDLSLHGEKSLFKDQKEFKSLAKQPLAAAYKFASGVFQSFIKSMAIKDKVIPQFSISKEKEIQEDSEYFKYKQFFFKQCKSPKKCILNGDAVETKNKFIPILMRTEALKSYALEEGLKTSQVPFQLARFIEDLKPELLIQIPEWDGVDRIKKAVNHVTLTGDMTVDHFENYLKYWGSRIFARLKNPDEQNIFIILKGPQGIGKDTFVKNLVRGFGCYASKFTVQPNKEIDTIHQIASNLVLHLEEFDQSHKLNVAFLKELITCEEKTYRLPYDRAAIRRKMYASFISTVNVENIFRDSTGNRRFAVFDIKAIDWSYPKGEQNQIVAQFKALYDQNYQLTDNAKSKMAEKISSLTPDSVDDELLDLWDTRVSYLIKAEQKSELKLEKVQHVIEDLRKQTGWQIKTVFSFLKQHGRSLKRGSNVLYTSGQRKDLL